MSQLMDQLRKMYGDLSTGRKISLLFLSLLIIGTISGLSYWGSRPQWRMLYSNLSVDDAGQVVNRLKEQHVMYKIGDGGRSILVPSDKVYEVRMQLAESGVPSGGIDGFELFDQGRLGMTNFQNKVSMQRALQGELSRTIVGLNEVEQCRVHLVMPDESLFVEEERPATASVVLKVRSGRHLSQAQVEGITHLVASAVDQLDAEHVTVLDQDGTLLSRITSADSGIGMRGSRLELKQKFEQELEKRLRSMLESTLGPNKVVVRVNADMDFSSSTKILETYDPRGQVVRSEQVTNEKNSSNEGSREAGVPGIDSNVPQTAQAGSRSSNSADRKISVTNYEVSKTVSEVVGDGPLIKRLSVAVLVDGKYQTAAAGSTAEGAEGEGATSEGKGESEQDGPAYVARTAEELSQIESAVKSAIGFDNTRGDTVSVVNIPFESKQPWLEEAPSNPLEQYMPYIRYGLMALAAILFLLIVLRPLIRWITSDTSTEAEERLARMLPAGVRELETVVDGESGLATAALPAGRGQQDIMDRRRIELENRRKLAQENAKQDPKAIIGIIRKWLRED